MKALCCAVTIIAAACDNHATVEAFVAPEPTQTSARLHQYSGTPATACLHALNGHDEETGQSSINSALKRMEQIMQPNFHHSSSPLLGHFHKSCVSSVEVRPSSISGAGLGLFARKNIKAGTIISLYPAHCLGVDSDEGDPRCTALGDSDRDYFDYEVTQKQDGNYLLYILGSRPLMSSDVKTTFGGNALFIDVNPSRDVSPGWVSHLINDGSTVSCNNEEGVMQYYASTRRARNCVHIPFGPAPIMATCVTKKVKKGSELFTSYGCSYWLEALLEAEGGECTEITDDIQKQVQETARDLFQAVQRVGTTYEGEAFALQEIFNES